MCPVFSAVSADRLCAGHAPRQKEPEITLQGHVLDVFSGDPESPQLVLTAAGQRDPVTAKNRPGQMTGAVRLAYSAS